MAEMTEYQRAECEKASLANAALDNVKEAMLEIRQDEYPAKQLKLARRQLRRLVKMLDESADTAVHL